MDSANCAPFARDWLLQAMDIGKIDKYRAEMVRRAIMVAQGHNLPVAESVDYVGDAVLIRIGEKIYHDYNVGNLDRRAGNASNPFVSQACPGIDLYKKYL